MRVPIRQLNDYAISKWVNEQQVMNATDEWGAEIVRVRLFNTYGPGEYFSEYRSAICKFIYKAMFKLPLTIYLDHRRTSTYVTDTCRTLANISDSFVPGAVYNIGGEELHDMKSVNDMILGFVGTDDSHVTYEESEPMTTKDKVVDCSRARADLKHEPSIPLRDRSAEDDRVDAIRLPGRRLAESRLKDLDDPLGGVTVPQWRDGDASVRGPTRCRRRSSTHALFVQPGDRVRTLGNRDRAALSRCGA